ncbi:MAG: hypothetical protein GTN60_18900 [Pseudomonas stutzeri]|nr:hypothetical protein [Stutzerimonas stutzeri]NIN82602.1 hypothetical protein [Stutzerimonas stutzeri]NIP02739.1 hypothetical protein [Stutzerimonas stutzeri]NIQ24456.1 hypothetical protein [Stutzerimonas stutzeri]
MTQHATSEEFVYRHRWQVGDALFWDNRRVLHAGSYYDTNRYQRLMHRTMVTETEPIQ